MIENNFLKPLNLFRAIKSKKGKATETQHYQNLSLALKHSTAMGGKCTAVRGEKKAKSALV